MGGRGRDRDHLRYGRGMNVGFIDHGDYLKIKNVNFGAGAAAFEARVASAGSGGNIEPAAGQSGRNTGRHLCSAEYRGLAELGDQDLHGQWSKRDS